MQNKKLKKQIENILKTDKRLWDKETGDLNQTLLIDLVEKSDEKIIALFLKNEEIREKFFLKINDVFVFKTRDFKFFIEENKIDNSYTAYKNKIGLTDGKYFLKDTNDVVLNFPFKDCVLEGGQSNEEGEDNYFEYDEEKEKTVNGEKIKLEAGYKEKSAKRKEIFYNQVLASDEIDRLLDEKALVNWKRFTKNGEEKVGKLKRNEDGVIRENLIIKGNNLLAMHSLQKNFAGKVKLIYIDPPYNTGTDSFKYNDNFNHSTWLTFMKNRLEIAKKLLADDGVIFVQCDDNEQAYLKVLMDEVFGRENFISNSIIVINRGGRDYGGISKTHEYILIYGKKETELNLIEEKNKKFDYEDKTSGFNLMELRNRNVKFNIDNRPNLCYSFYVNPNNEDKNGLLEISLEKRNGFIELLPLKSQGIQTVWRWGREKVVKNINIEIKGKKKQDGGYMIVQKYRKSTKRQKSIWDDKNYVNEKGTLHIKNLFDLKIFDYPKSEFCLKTIIELSTKEGDIVLDYHLGSGTTTAVAHKMNRQYIGIEQMDYIEDIAVERMKKVIGGEQGGISKSVDWKGGGEFVYFELAEWNEQAKEKINDCKNLAELEKLFDEMCEKYFLHYNMKVKDFREKTIKEENFAKLSLEEQKKTFVAMLDLNQMYVNRSEMADEKFGVGEEDRESGERFYKNK